MAIVVEEEQKSSVSMVGVLTWVLIIGAILAASYFLFFKRPDLIPITVPENFKNTESLSKVDPHADSVLEDVSYKALHDFGIVSSPKNIGRTNPFLGF